MPSEKQIEAATTAIIDKIQKDGFVGYMEAVSIILTAAEQAEPAPAARSGAVKVDELAEEIRRVDGNNSLGAGALAEALMPFLAALEPAEPATDGEPVVDFLHGMPPQEVIEAAQKVERYFSSKGIRQWELYGVASRGNPHPPESRLREALEFYADSENWKQNGPLDPNSGNFTGGPSRSALAQEDGR